MLVTSKPFMLGHLQTFVGFLVSLIAIIFKQGQIIYEYICW